MTTAKPGAITVFGPLRPDLGRGAGLNLALAMTGFLVCFWAWALLSPLAPGIKERLGLGFAAQSFLVAVPVWVVVGIAWLVFTIIAAVKSNDGIAYRYPFTLRLVKYAPWRQSAATRSAVKRPSASSASSPRRT